MNNKLQEFDAKTYFDTDEDKRTLLTKGFNFEIFNALKNILTDKEKTELANLNETFIQKSSRLTPQLRQKEFERLTVELAWKSSKIEGSTYTIFETERLLKEHIPASAERP